MFLSIYQKVLCLFNQHHWKPYGMQWFIAPALNVCGYRDATCSYCGIPAGQPTNFYLTEVPIEHLFGSASPFQVSEDGVVWYTMSFGPPPGIGLKTRNGSY